MIQSNKELFDYPQRRILIFYETGLHTVILLNLKNLMPAKQNQCWFSATKEQYGGSKVFFRKV